MTPEAAADTSAKTPGELDSRQRRILGVLVEKAKTTPEVYPLSVNALATGCNQKSNRDPVTNLTAEQVEETLEDLLPRGLVSRVQGGRVERWRHHLYEVWNVNKVELAVLAELLLRGAQTEGELRTRASRMEPIADVEGLRAVLGPLKERGLIVFLGPEGRRGTTLTHGFHAPRDLDRLRSAPRPEPQSEAEMTPPSAPSESVAAALAQARADIAALQQQVAIMQETLSTLSDQVRQLKDTPDAGVSASPAS